MAILIKIITKGIVSISGIVDHNLGAYISTIVKNKGKERGKANEKTVD